jgi:hypothetical protein
MSGILVFATLSTSIGKVLGECMRQLRAMMSRVGAVLQLRTSTADEYPRPIELILFTKCFGLLIGFLLLIYVRRLAAAGGVWPALLHARLCLAVCPVNLRARLHTRPALLPSRSHKLMMLFVRAPHKCAQPSASIFVVLDPQWRFFDALYHSMMTATTVGLGEYAPITQGARAFAVFHILVSVIFFGNFVTTLVDVQDVLAQHRKKQELLRKSPDTEMITSLDVDGHGIDRAEYVVGMLLKLDLVREEDVRPFFEEFKQLDKDGSGHLDKKDLELAAQNVCRVGLRIHAHRATLPRRL